MFARVKKSGRYEILEPLFGIPHQIIAYASTAESPSVTPEIKMTKQLPLRLIFYLTGEPFIQCIRLKK